MIPRPHRLVAALVAVLLAACGTDLPAPNGGQLAKSDKPRLSASSVPAADVTEQAHDDTAFAFDLYAQLAPTPGNLFFSPHSISTALALTWAGARGQTASDMASALQFSMPAERTHAAFNALDQALQSRAQVGTSEDGGPFKFNVANAIWSQVGMDLQQPFLDTLAQDYGAGVHLEDFVQAPAAALSDINGWVSQNTAGKIPKLLEAGDVTDATRMVLTNAVYFNASWKTPFEESATQDAPFHALDGSTPTVSMMHAGLETAYAQGSGWEAVEIPYSNPDLSLTVIVPAQGQFGAVEGQLSAAFLDQVIAAEGPADVTLALPKFDITTKAHLKGALMALGMGSAFDDADFSGIDGQRDLAIGDVIHQATVRVDEAGTEAAAATAVIILGSAAPANPVTLTVDRPFILALRDRPTGAVVFLGRVTQP